MADNDGSSYTLIGGNGVKVSKLEVTEDGTYKAGDSEAFNPVIVRAGGGGSGGSMLVLHVNETEQAVTLDKTAKEILDAISAGKSIVIDAVSGSGRHNYSLFVGYLTSVAFGYYFYFVNFDAREEVTVMYFEFQTDTENGYPAFVPGP